MESATQNQPCEIDHSDPFANVPSVGIAKDIPAERPLPLIADDSRPQDYPVDSLDVFQHFVVAIAEQTRTQPHIAAQCVLSVAGLATQGIANVQTLGGDSPLSLFALTIAKSGERKSTVFDLAMRGINDFARERHDQHNQEKKQHSFERAAFDADFMRAVKEGSGVPPYEPVEPLQPKLTVKAPTTEGLIQTLHRGVGSIGVMNDEAGTWLGGHSMRTETKFNTLAKYSDLWGGQPLDHTTAGEGSIFIRDKRLTMHLMVQPEIIRPLLADPMARC